MKIHDLCRCIRQTEGIEMLVGIMEPVHDLFLHLIRPRHRRHLHLYRVLLSHIAHVRYEVEDDLILVHALLRKLFMRFPKQAVPHLIQFFGADLVHPPDIGLDIIMAHICHQHAPR